MGDTAVDIFQETLKQLITNSKLSLIIKEKHQLQSLEEEIKYLRGFLKDTEKKRNDHPEVMNLVKQIRDLIAEAENIVELFVVHAFKADHVPYSLREHLDHLFLYLGTIIKGLKNIVVHAFKADHLPYSLCEHEDHLSLDLGTIKKGMKTLTAEVKKIYDENMYGINGVAVKQLKHYSTGIGEDSGSSRGSNTSKVVKENEIVGFEEEINRLIDKLDDKGEGRPLEIISIIGAGGSGKTTLARKAYDHPFTSYAFEIRAWIDVSQDYGTTRKRDLLIRILESITGRNCETSSDDKLGEDIVLKCLKGKKYLIVMDDIWGIEAWNDIQRSFPKECKGSKVLFTSRLLVQLDSVGYFPYYLAPLTKKWCWELLQKKVFGMKCCPLELVDIAEEDNFLVRVDEYDSFSPSATNKHRRLFIGDEFFQKLSLVPRNLRSFLCLRLQEKYPPMVGDNLSFFVENFELLRVLHFLHVPCNGEIGIGRLVHLRYLAITYVSSRFRAPPFSYLLNLETFYHSSEFLGNVVVRLPHDIVKMVKLRHLYTRRGIFIFHHSSEEYKGSDFDRSSSLDDLQTFHLVCACEVCRRFLVRTSNLRKLGLYAGITSNDMFLRFPNLEFLKCLEKLTVFDKPVGRTFAPGLKLPLSITRITLKSTCLKWEELSLLQNLPKLEVLRLILFACVGPVWNASEIEGFPQLKYLNFNNLDIEEWNAFEDQFPKLEVLVIKYCHKLKQIPIAFGNLNELHEIKLVACTRSVEESARQIREE
ncbi:hypothetical protein Vadar_008499 [Vaccinium darrowii]|uniref:Uncharacterized protein n=1 Tax=Vaccinium darrowii TaxID=229202 RepID=A0ACB7XYF2_9ERIC|nr:hypothetical protein Vadar_008499 [Vaccinium darrowii]